MYSFYVSLFTRLHPSVSHFHGSDLVSLLSHTPITSGTQGTSSTICINIRPVVHPYPLLILSVYRTFLFQILLIFILLYVVKVFIFNFTARVKLCERRHDVRVVGRKSGILWGPTTEEVLQESFHARLTFSD